MIGKRGCIKMIYPLFFCPEYSSDHPMTTEVYNVVCFIEYNLKNPPFTVFFLLSSYSFLFVSLNPLAFV